MRLLELARTEAPNLEASEACGKPRLLAKALRTAHRDLTPTARLGNHDQTANDLGVLARGRQPAAPIGERSRAIRKVVVLADPHEALLDMVRNESTPLRWCPGVLSALPAV